MCQLEEINSVCVASSAITTMCETTALAMTMATVGGLWIPGSRKCLDRAIANYDLTPFTQTPHDDAFSSNG